MGVGAAVGEAPGAGDEPGAAVGDGDVLGFAFALPLPLPLPLPFDCDVSAVEGNTEEAPPPPPQAARVINAGRAQKNSASVRTTFIGPPNTRANELPCAQKKHRQVCSCYRQSWNELLILGQNVTQTLHGAGAKARTAAG